MDESARENIAKFFFDGRKITFTVLVVGIFAKKPFVLSDALGGFVFTLILFIILGVIMNHWKTKREDD